MRDGRFVRAALLITLLLPVALAAPPATNLDAPRSLDGQDVSDLALEPSGQFVAAVVTYDATKGATGGLPGLPPTSTGPPHYDVYTCNFGPASAPRTGTGCTGRNYTSASGALSTSQDVDFVSQTVSGSIQGNVAVAGPSGLVSLWNQGGVQRWACNVPDTTGTGASAQVALNVSLPSDARRLAVTSAPATGGGRLLVYDATQTCRLLWALNLSARGASTRPTALDYARDGGIVAVGTDAGVLLFSPDVDSAPTGNAPIVGEGRVSDVVLSRNGDTVVAGVANFVFMAAISRSGGSVTVPSATVASYDLQGSAGPVAMAKDGQRFAVAAGSKIRFYHRDPTVVAAPDGTYDAGAPVSDLAYDATGRLLVAVAGNHLIGFANGRPTPLWTLDATTPAGGALDGPLRKVAVSDDAQRIVVAGKTKVMAYTSLVGVTAALTAANGNSTMPPGSTLPLTLTVKNTGSLPDNYTFVVVPPVGWPQQSADGLRLDPDQTGTVSLNLSAPAGEKAGTYGVEVRVRSAQHVQQTGRSDVFVAGPAFNVTIPRSVQLAVEMQAEPLFVKQGGDETVAVTIRNHGNEDGIVNLSARQDVTRASWTVRFSSDQVRVPAAGSADVTMTVTAPLDGAKGDTTQITVSAKEGQGDSAVVAERKLLAYIDPQFGVEITASNASFAFAPSEVRTLQVKVRNTGNTRDTYGLNWTLTPAAAANDWSVTLDLPSIEVDRGATRDVNVVVRPRVAEPNEATLIVSAKSQTSSSTPEQAVQIALIAKERTTQPTEKGLLPFPSVALLVPLALALALALRRGGQR